MTVSSLTAGTVLAPGTDYTVTCMGNTSLGLAYAVIVGRGEYAAYTNNAPFIIRSIGAYYIVGGTAAGTAGNSTVSGGGSNPTGWATTKSGSKSINGVTAQNAIYHVWLNRWVLTPPRKNYATPPTSAIVVEPSCKWELGDKLTGQTLTLSNLFIRAGGKLIVGAVGDGAVTVNNTYAGN